MQKQKTRTITKLAFILVAIVIGMILTFVSFGIPGTRGIVRFRSFAGSIKLGIDLKGGVYALYDVAADEPDRENLDARLDGTVARLLSMINAAG
ncbi:MAG: hypothetical protein FWE62_04075, partial [Firmicutes bacterium]|nr:hypothetical protein [Bacillota bacterium]